MNDSEKHEFGRVVTNVFLIYEKNPEKAVIDIWWHALRKFDFADVRKAFSRFVTGPDGKFAPKPAHIIELLTAGYNDGRPGAEEAWAMFPKDEADSAMVTTEMSEAWGAASPLWRDGERVGARMAFKERYQRIVESNRANGVDVAWMPTLGTDMSGREYAIQDGISRKLLAPKFALDVLPPENAERVLSAVGERHLLPAPSAEGIARLNGMIRQLRGATTI